MSRFPETFTAWDDDKLLSCVPHAPDCHWAQWSTAHAPEGFEREHGEAEPFCNCFRLEVARRLKERHQLAILETTELGTRALWAAELLTRCRENVAPWEPWLLTFAEKELLADIDLCVKEIEGMVP